MAKKRSSPEPEPGNRYSRILERIFHSHYSKGTTSFEFARTEIETAAAALGIELPRNLGDLLYSFRFRSTLPPSIAETAPAGYDWIIELAGRAKYRMILPRITRVVPSEGRVRIKIPDATPEIVAKYSLTDEQAVLARVRYNRLIDVFLRVTAYSLQNHLRTSVRDVGQIEIDEVYVAVNNAGQQFVVPVQAKGGNDRIGAVQAMQDLAMCRTVYPQLTPRPVAVQFLHDEEEVIVMFELTQEGDEIRVVDERHYRLVAASEITDADLEAARQAPL